MKKRGRPKAPPSPADEAEAQALDAAVQAIIEGVLSDWDYSRPLRSLNRNDLERIASAAISGWVVARSKQGCTTAEQNDLILHVGFVG